MGCGGIAERSRQIVERGGGVRRGKAVEDDCGWLDAAKRTSRYCRSLPTFEVDALDGADIPEGVGSNGGQPSPEYKGGENRLRVVVTPKRIVSD